MESPEPPVHRLGYLIVWIALMAVSFIGSPDARPDHPRPDAHEHKMHDDEGVFSFPIPGEQANHPL